MVCSNVYGQTITEWLDAYRHGATTPDKALADLHDLLTQQPDAAWILVFDWPVIARQLQSLAARRDSVGIDALPLYGVPFAIKDNIDYAGQVTTAACPAFAYVAQHTATAVQCLLDAGAILVGKTNLDQFATGLVGTRSPFGIVGNSFDSRYISGGSSSGSASVVARGQVPFALGTDTAGSGRVPAGLNNIVGLKPTRGACSTHGVVPACRTLDCVSVFALDVEDAWRVFHLMAQYDEQDPYSRPLPSRLPLATLPARPRIGVPASPQWFGDDVAEKAWLRTLDSLEAMGVECVPVDFAPLHAMAALLYNGPWLAERLIVIRELLETSPEQIHAVVRDIIAGAGNMSAADAFIAEYQRAALKREADGLMATVDALLVPTAPTLHTIAAVEEDPVALNSQLGHYTNFVNLCDWSALALPAGFRDDGLPFGITLIGNTWQDYALAEFGQRWQRFAPWHLGATGKALPAQTVALPLPAQQDNERVRVAVVGAHLSGMPLNFQLTTRQAVLVEKTHTADHYRLFALANTTPPKPGLVKSDHGNAIEIEIWEMPMHRFGEFVAEVPPPLGIGNVETADGRIIKSFICEPAALEGATEITALGGWRAYIAQRETRQDNIGA